MADPEQVKRLIVSVEDWNSWRKQNPGTMIDLNNAMLSGANLVEANLHRADLHGAYLFRTNLFGANLVGANLVGAFLIEANLRDANLSGADFSGTDFNGADLSRVNLRGSDLSGTYLRGVDLGRAHLQRVNLNGAYISYTDLTEADLTDAILGTATIASINLSNALGLEHIAHVAPSDISTNTLELSKGKIPEVFLRGCGLSDWEIESSKLYRPDLSNQEINDIIYKVFDLRARRAIQISPLFISYSHADSAFVEKLGIHLTETGVRYWRDVHHAKAGRLEKQIDRAMRHNPTVLLVLSENSINSDWVEHEARLARELEKELKRDVLCPVALDDSWKTCNWPKRLMEQITEYHVLDFSKWEDNESFEQMFSKMISGLDMFYKK